MVKLALHFSSAIMFPTRANVCLKTDKTVSAVLSFALLEALAPYSTSGKVDCVYLTHAGARACKGTQPVRTRDTERGKEPSRERNHVQIVCPTYNQSVKQGQRCAKSAGLTGNRAVALLTDMNDSPVIAPIIVRSH